MWKRKPNPAAQWPYNACMNSPIRHIFTLALLMITQVIMAQQTVISGRVIDATKAVAIPMDREVIHVIPQEYELDGQDGIKQPVGMSGVRLIAKVHIVTSLVSSVQNVIRCANRCNLQVSDITVVILERPRHDELIAGAVDLIAGCGCDGGAGRVGRGRRTRRWAAIPCARPRRSGRSAARSRRTS